MRVEQIGDATLYLGDCRDILPTLPKVNATFADPPYGINYRGSATIWVKDAEHMYESFDDTPENVETVCVPSVVTCINMSDCVALTPGIRCARLYPMPVAEGVIWYPAGANSGPFGFVTHQPIYYYGACPYLRTGKGRRPTGFEAFDAAEKNGHPCPKPIRQMHWLVTRISFHGHTVLDPFMGSGTTGVACAQLGRKFIGIEREPKYFDIACRRIEQAYAQGRLFDEPAPNPTQEALAL